MIKHSGVYSNFLTVFLSFFISHYEAVVLFFLVIVSAEETATLTATVREEGGFYVMSP